MDDGVFLFFYPVMKKEVPDIYVSRTFTVGATVVDQLDSKSVVLKCDGAPVFISLIDEE